jgi:hypothetical protein
MKDAYGDLRALYRAARREEEPTRADRRLVRAALLGAGTASVALQASAATAKLVSAIPAATKLFTVGQLASLVSVGVALGTGVAVVGVATSPRPRAPAVTVTVPQQQNSRPFANRPAVTRPVVAAKTDALIASSGAESVPAPSVLDQQPITGSPVRQPTSNDQQPALLLAESRGLAEVQGALNAQDPAKALQLLSAQESAFHSGALGQEREAARVIALCAAGQKAEAALLRDQFLTAYPTSLLARRVSGVCSK